MSISPSPSKTVKFGRLFLHRHLFFARTKRVNELQSRNLHEDDDDTFLTSQEIAYLQKTFIKVNQENNIKKGNNSKVTISIRYLPKMMQMTLANPHKIQC